MREATIERKHRTIARAAGWFVEKIMATGMNGFPDRFYARARRQDICRTCMRGRVVLLEWKSPVGVLSKQQELRISQLKAAGVEVYVVRSIEEANRILGIPTAEYRICKCGCGRKFQLIDEEQVFAFDACRIAWERAL